jgi:hypothetical protein
MQIPQVNKKDTQRQIFVSLLVILFCCVISYWPVSLGIFSLKNDAIRYFLPVRYQVSEMIRNGHFPFWTPYINLGHPLYTDMQSGVWNPFVWLISFFGSYSMRSLQFELLIYVYISGVSMFFLLKYLKLSLPVSLVLAISYMLSGFISDSTQFPYWVCGIAFLPAVFLFFLKMLRENSFHHILLFSFFIYLLFVTSYPGEFIIIVYFLFAYFIVHLVQNKKDLLRLLKTALAALFVFTLFSLPVIISYLSGLDFISRGTAVSYDLALTNSMNPLSLISYIFPLVTWKLPIAETDILGRNSFIGLFPFILIIISFAVRSKSTLVSFLKWVFVLSLFLSFGKYGLLRPLSYYLLPFMDTFRHPSLFRFLTIFCGCILAAFTFQEFLNKDDNRIKRNIFVSVLILIVVSSLAILIINNARFYHFLLDAFNITSIRSWIEKSTAINWLIFEIIIQAFFLFLIYKFFIKKINLNLLTLTIIINSVIHTAFIQPATVVSSETVSAFTAEINTEKQNGFPLPDLQSTILSNSKLDENYFLKYGPVNMYNKKLGYQFEFVTPGPLRSHERFMNTKDLSSALFNFPVLYRADTACFIRDTMNLPTQKKFILTDDPALHSFINKGIKDPDYEARMLSYSPDKWEFEIHSAAPGFYWLLQNYYPNWELFVNDKKEKTYVCNLSLLGFKLEPGINKVRLQFKDNKVKAAYYIQLFALAALIIYFFLFFLRRKNIK